MERFVETLNMKFIDNKQLTIVPDNFKNIILFSSNENNNYEYALNIIKKYSPSQLNYDKKITITYNDDEYIYRISDIHIEINFEFLGCISKNLWAAIYNQIILSTNRKPFIILCKNFSTINNELLDNFYTYMNVKEDNIRYIFLMKNISCIPKEIIDTSIIISNKKPAKKYLSQLNITNNYVKNLLEYIVNHKKYSIKHIRNLLYDLLIYQIDIHNFFYNLLEEIEKTEKNNEKIIKLLNEVNKILKLFNNNYRSIYHLENLVITIINILYLKS